MNGFPIENLADLAVLIRAWRKPRYMNLRHVYGKDGAIVGYEGPTTLAKANAFGLIGYTREGVKHLKDRVFALCADSVYMIHNCPSTDSVPPTIKKGLIALCSEMVPELKAHIIIYPASFGLISVRGICILHVLPDIPSKLPDSQLSHMHVSRLKASPQLAAWAKALTARKSFFVISLGERENTRSLEKINLQNIDKLGTYVD
jgi:hypothetical protein